MLMFGRISFQNLLTGQRSEMSRYEYPWEVSLPGFGIGMINDDLPYSPNLTSGDREVEEGGDILNRSRSKIVQVENAKFVWAKCITILQLMIALITRSAVNVCVIFIGFLLLSLVYNRDLLEEVCTQL